MTAPSLALAAALSCLALVAIAVVAVCLLPHHAHETSLRSRLAPLMLLPWLMLLGLHLLVFPAGLH